MSGVENEKVDAGRDGTRRLNPSVNTRFSGANGNRENVFQLTTGDRKDWQPLQQQQPPVGSCPIC